MVIRAMWVLSNGKSLTKSHRIYICVCVIGFCCTIISPSLQAEFGFVCSQIRTLLLNGCPEIGPITPSDIAILYRNNSIGDDLKKYMDTNMPDYGVNMNRIQEFGKLEN